MLGTPQPRIWVDQRRPHPVAGELARRGWALVGRHSSRRTPPARILLGRDRPDVAALRRAAVMVCVAGLRPVRILPVEVGRPATIRLVRADIVVVVLAVLLLLLLPVLPVIRVPCPVFFFTGAQSDIIRRRIAVVRPIAAAGGPVAASPVLAVPRNVRRPPPAVTKLHFVRGVRDLATGSPAVPRVWRIGPGARAPRLYPTGAIPHWRGGIVVERPLFGVVIAPPLRGGIPAVLPLPGLPARGAVGAASRPPGWRHL